MQRRIEVLRFKEGQRIASPPPEVFWEPAPEGVPAEAGEALLILVDLEPYIPHRAREVRTLVEEVYWTASGSITARMRRAIAQANRYLVQHNSAASPELRALGSLSLISFWQEEAFIGQVGPGNTLIHYPQQRLLELFPKAERTPTPLGVAVPPIIHIGYATLEPGCQVVLLTNTLMQTRLIPAWEELLAAQAAAPDKDIFAASLAQKQVSGGAIHVLCLADEEEPVASAQPHKPRFFLWPWSKGESAPSSVKAPVAHATRAVPPAEKMAAPQAAMPVSDGETPARPAHAIRPVASAGEEAPWSPAAPVIPPAAVGEETGGAPASQPRRSSLLDLGRQMWASLWARQPEALEEGEEELPDVASQSALTGEKPEDPGEQVAVDRTPAVQKAVASSAVAVEEESMEEGAMDEQEPTGWRAVWHGLKARLQAARPSEEGTVEQSQPRAGRFSLRWKVRRGQGRQAARRLKRFVHATLRPLLPGRGASSVSAVLRPVPAETGWLPWLALLLVLGALLVTGLAYANMGGAQRTAALLSEAEEARALAYEQQTPENWRKVQTLANRVLVLDAENAKARALRDEATLALDALQKAALLAITPLRELGASPQPRRLLVTESAIYLLNPLTDEVMVLDPREPGAARSLLKRGQVVNGHTVVHLVDIAWMEPAPGFLDGALFVYGDGGYLYTYEPTLGPESITVQSLPGDLPPGAVTMIGLWGTRLYLVQRQANALLRYQPLNGLYNAPPRPYFAPTATPPLQNVLAMALDGRVYLLFGDGSLRAYYEGAEDPVFKVQGGTEPTFQAMLMTLDPNRDGLIYLADPRQGLIVMLDRKGTFRHQFRLPGHLGRNLETLAVSPDGKKLYLVADNKLYVAPLPDFVQ